jgi:heat shock protein HslJ
VGTSPGAFTYNLNTATFPAGQHALRLRVVRGNSNYDEYLNKVTFAPQAPATTTAPAATTTSANTITGIVWQWMSVTNQTTKKTDTVPNPENYTITFDTNGTLTGKADCNNFSGTYTQTNGFSIKLGATTQAYCGAASLDTKYLSLLSEIAAGGPDGAGNLALETAGGEQRMLFKNGGAVNAPAAPSTAAALTEAQLKNAEYNSQYTASGKAKLVNGTYEEAAAPGSASKVTVTYEQSASGDLNGDGVPDAAVILASSTGGSGTFMTLEAVLNQGGQPVPTATAQLGDRTQVKSVSIDGGVITVQALIHGANDPLCCPTQAASLKYQLKNGQLVQIAGPAPVAAAPAVKTTTPVTATAALPNVNGIKSPADGATIGGIVLVTGYANSRDFNRWQLDLLPGGNANQAIFLAIDTGAGAFTYHLNTPAYAPGDYQLRLRVVRNDSNYDEYFTKVTIASAPAKPAISPAAAVVTATHEVAAQNVNGIVTPKDGANISGPTPVAGYANSVSFMKWQLDLVPNGIKGIVPIFLTVGTTPGQFTYTLPAGLFPIGGYQLRLRVVHENSNYDEYFTNVRIAR